MLDRAPGSELLKEIAMKGLTYRFKVGQVVDLIPSTSRLAANGHYQIVSLRPADRIKSRHEPHERVVAEDDLILAPDLKFNRA
jgi:hypothetical protein